MKENHIIQKVFVEVTVNNKEKAYHIKDEINNFLSIDVFPEIEKYIKGIEYKLADHTLQIPRLELDLDVKSSSLDAELKDKIAQLFKDELEEIAKPEEISHQEREKNSKYWINNQEKMVQTFLYFLENGSMPWWNSDKEGVHFLETAVFETLVSAPNFSKTIISALPKSHVQDRIINQLSD
ncbi:contractile injection system tape measure protein, partial [uncultured Chryseobacterium sp.]|uniref:contractile injection system tape measure protein n=1 Tax=uncultured Chryseobacterium sp. TaxID=259322 RepID=UPI002627A07E